MIEVNFYEEVADELIENWTYPAIQPKLVEEAKRRGVL